MTAQNEIKNIGNRDAFDVLCTKCGRWSRQGYGMLFWFADGSVILCDRRGKVTAHADEVALDNEIAKFF